MDLGEWDAKASTTAAFVLLITSLCLFILLLILIALFCRKSRSADGSILLSKMDGNSNSSCMNDAFDFEDETAPRRIEERRHARQRALFCDDTRADGTADRFDRSMGHALAIEALLRNSYVFDTNILDKPLSEVEIVAAKRDYL